MKTYIAAGAVVTAHESIPEPPPVPAITEPLNALGEPTLASLGLGGWTPVGMVQNCLEYLHVSLGVPWWEAVVIGKGTPKIVFHSRNE